MQSFQDRTQTLRIEEAGWENLTNIYGRELEEMQSTFGDLIQNCKERLLERLLQIQKND